jgi:uncharacterized membrane protein
MVLWILKVKDTEIPTVGIIIFLGVTIWSLGMIIAPLTLPANSVGDLTPDQEKDRWGVGTVDHAEITKDMNPYGKHYYEAGDFNCHTLKERSFLINGNQMPFCARDVGIFFGMAIGLGLALFIRFELKLWWLFGGLVPMGVDWLLNSYLGIYHNNLTRLGTGGLAGIVITLALGYVVYDISKDAEIKKRFKESTLENSEYPQGTDEIVNPHPEMKDGDIPSPESKITPIQNEPKTLPEEEIK